MAITAWIFILIWSVIILVPCVAIAWLGYRFITQLGQYPSKTPVLQKDVMRIYVVIAIVSFTIILLFFKVLSSEK